MRLRSTLARATGAGLDLWFPLALVAVTLVLSLFSISGSSLGNWSRSGKVDDADVVAGEPLKARSDEWLATSPMKLGRIRADFPDTAVFGMGTVDLGDSWRPQVVSRALPAALYSPFNLPLVVLPVEQGFALYWWLPLLACALGLYAWLRLMRVTKGLAAAVALLVTWSPVVVWWSGWPAQSIAHAVIPCALVIAATRLWARRRGLAVAVAVVGGLAAAGLPWWYQPWGIPTAIFAAGVTLLWGLGDAQHRRPFVYVGLVAGAVFGLESIVYLLHERSYYDALANTAYPGDRRELGGGVGLGKLLSGELAFPIAELPGDPGAWNGRGVIAESVPELAMGWTIALPVAVLAVALARRSVARSSERVLVFGTALLGLALGSWAVVEYPSVVGKLTLLTFAQAERVAPFIGFFGLVALALLLATPQRRERVRADLGRSGAVIIGVGTAFAVAWGVAEFRASYYPDASKVAVVLAVLVTAAIAGFLFTRRWAWALATATVLGVGSGIIVNPLMHGLGNVEDSAAATTVRAIDRRLVAPAGGTWAADSVYGVGLLNGQGVDSLSSYNDPVDERGWHVLDPSGRYEGVWNRFGYVVFQWVPGLAEPEIVAPVSDQVFVRADPCDPRFDRLRLTVVVSSAPLDQSACLTPVRDVRWSGSDLHLYERSPTA